jgi:NAD(P)-dependent dehydrogenase (short-subunit alcohol dehydrogenase family)
VHLATLDKVAVDIRSKGGRAETARVDAMDQRSVEAHADRVAQTGVTEEDVAQLLRDTLTGRLPRLSEVADTALYLASDAAGAISGAAVNLSCGAVFG